MKATDARLSLSADGSHVVDRFHRPFRDGSRHVVPSLREFIARLAALIPRPRIHLVTYHSGDPPEHARSGEGPRGRSEGKAEGRADTIVRMLQKRFGPLPADVVERIRHGTEADLHRWTDRVRDARTLFAD